ncbi:Aste57867_8929 [Aphanomyces stellatus]|uniref:Aste57867_8929 protein n=1 Tax=Aphanomyces stellatus TaxID=120398 RepID=A0A485KLL3_9STRA|nr:hypothetical protein As57867_008894 [Aphanomyces stellatus]VFT85813.1 Aste57867_8929 [Aphanomyces stellatus]
MEILQPQSARFLSNNLELLGFGNPRSALVQAVKELFENALDAIQLSATGMISLRLKETSDMNFVEIVCTDTGSGMKSNQIAQLCCGVFATTKSTRTFAQCGKFGVGLKAALLFSQIHVKDVDACLKVTSTLNSEEFYYAELAIDPEAPQHDSALIRKSKHFRVSEDHKSFSGTEIRLQLPRPEDLHEALRVMMYYFDNLRYSLGSSISVEFACDLLGFDHCHMNCTSSLEPLDRFLEEFQSSYDSLAHVDLHCESFHVNCLAVAPYLDETELDGKCAVTIHLLRYANHVPLLPDMDLHNCAITSSLQNSNWKSFGYKCISGDSIYAPLRLVPLACEESREAVNLIVAVDVDTCNEITKFSSLKKTSLESDYQTGVSSCISLMLDQLPTLYPTLFERTSREDRIATYAPLISNAVASILAQATSVGVDVTHFEPGGLFYGVQSQAMLTDRVLLQMHNILEH